MLDNFEQLVAAAPMVASWLAQAPHLSVLATSRERLRLRGEREISLDPSLDERAVELFCERAGEAGCEVSPGRRGRTHLYPGRQLPFGDRAGRPEGRLHSIGELANRLQRRLDESDAARDLPARHQSVRATIEWSVDLLSLVEREGFARLSIFRSPFTVADAVAVAAVDEATLGFPPGQEPALPVGGRVARSAAHDPRLRGRGCLDQLGLRNTLERSHLEWMDVGDSSGGRGIHLWR